MARIETDNMFYGAAPVLFEFARQLRAKETAAETLLWQRISKKQLANFRFRRQHPILYFIADFYCHEAKLIVEIDGGVHLLPEQFQYDRARDNELRFHGLNIVRFSNEEVFNNIDNVVERILSCLTSKYPNGNFPD